MKFQKKIRMLLSDNIAEISKEELKELRKNRKVFIERAKLCEENSEFFVFIFTHEITTDDLMVSKKDADEILKNRKKKK